MIPTLIAGRARVGWYLCTGADLREGRLDVFVCLLGASPRTSDNLRRWAALAWPNAVEHRDGPLLLFTDGRNLSRVSEIGTHTVGCIDGVAWSDSEKTRDGKGILHHVCAGTFPLPSGFDGSYAVMTADAERSTINVTLDPIGVRRVFVGGSPGRWVVSSLQVPAAIALDLRVDKVGLSQILGLNRTLGRRTLFEGLEEILPGESWELSHSGRHRLGWEPAISQGKDPDKPIDAVAAELATTYIESMWHFARTTTDVGLALSGGIDSRLVLAGFLEIGRRPVLFSWGQPDEYETSIATRCAAAVGLPVHKLDLSRRMFPTEREARAFSLGTEALLHPAWVEMATLFRNQSVDTVALGNVTDSFQVRINGLWSRRARVLRGMNRMAGRRSTVAPAGAQYRSVEQWWINESEHLAAKVAAACDRFTIGLTPEEAISGTVDDLTTFREYLSTSMPADALEVEDAVHLLACRQVHGSQPQAVAGGAVGIDITATRKIGRLALTVPPIARADRQLLDAIARRVLPPQLAEIPTATIPVIPATSGWVLQDMVWGTRFAADQILRSANAKMGGRLRRDRAFRTLDLYSAYRNAGRSHFLAGDWGQNDHFNTEAFRGEYLGVVNGTGRRPMYPFRIHLGVRVDTMLSTADSIVGKHQD